MGGPVVTSMRIRARGQAPDMVARAIPPDYTVGAHVSALRTLFGDSLAFRVIVVMRKNQDQMVNLYSI